MSKHSVNYEEYILSKKWRRKANKAKIKAGWRCQICNTHKRNVPIHAHHRTYENLGNEKDTDITILCENCHKKHHRKLPKPPIPELSPREFAEDLLREFGHGLTLHDLKLTEFDEPNE